MNISNQQKVHQTRQLTCAFHAFNELSQDLAESYQGLQEQVAGLRQELTAARDRGMRTLLEKEKISPQLLCILVLLSHEKNSLLYLFTNSLSFTSALSSANSFAGKSVSRRDGG